MKIAIHTHPLHNNYGGLLQAFALQKVIKKMGHEVLTIDRQIKKNPKFILILSIIYRIFLKIFKRSSLPLRGWPTVDESMVISKNTRSFVEDNIRTTHKIRSKKDLLTLKEYNFDAIIVGSDQVWRPSITPGVTHYFLDFLDGNDEIKRISYAASFGVDYWEYSKKLTRKCASLAKKFDALSVREDSAVKMCQENLGVEATQVIDPTLLLNHEDYRSLIKVPGITPNSGKIYEYILDRNDDKEKIIEEVCKVFNTSTYSVMPEKRFTEVGKENLFHCIYPDVGEWIKGFHDAKFVITDSFHGTVFSIIFNKPFIAVGNKSRGISRFTSLLKLLDLERRLVIDKSDLTEEIILSPMNYDRINMILENEREKSLEFLQKSLKTY